MSAHEHAANADRLLVAPEGGLRTGRGTTEERVARAAEAQAHALTAIALMLTGLTSPAPDGPSRIFFGYDDRHGGGQGTIG